MNVTLNPKTEKLKVLCEKHGAASWVVLRNFESHPDCGGKPASSVCKNNVVAIVSRDEIK